MYMCLFKYKEQNYKNNQIIKSFALILNTTPLVVSSWIREETKPCGSSRRLMQLLSISPQ